MRAPFQKAVFSALSTAAVVLAVSGGAFAQFTQGNLVVSRVGDGSGTLSGVATAAFLDQYTTAVGQTAALNTLAFPTAANGANRTLTNSGSAVSEGFLSRSQDNRYLVYAGYDAAVGTAAIAGTTSATVNRVVARIDSSGSINTTTALTDAYNMANIRSAATVDGSSFFTGGTSSGTPATGGVRTTAVGGTTSAAAETAQNNVRVVNVFNSQTYFTTQTGIFRIDTGGTVTQLNSSAITSAYDFAINSTGTVLYVADDSAGIRKYNFNSATGLYDASYILTTTTVRGLAVDFSGTNAVLYATTASGTNANQVVRVTDVGAANATAVTLFTAATNTAFRDVAFSPFVVAANTPEPGSLALLGVGAVPGIGLLVARRRRARKTA